MKGVRQFRSLWFCLCCLFPLTSSGQSRQNDRIEIFLCTDDTPETATMFTGLATAALSMSTLRVSTRCEKNSFLRTSTAHFRAVFQKQENTVLLVLSSATHKMYHRRRIPWLKTDTHPLESTIQARKTAALCVLLESLLLDFESVELSRAPSLPEETVPTEAAEAAAPSDPEAAAADSTDRVLPGTLSIAAAAGIELAIPPSLAPRFELMGFWRFETFALILGGQLLLDSTFELEGRAFTAYGFGAHAGVAYVLGQFNETVELSINAVVIWRLNRYQRDQPDASPRYWSDLGLGVGARLGWRFHRSWCAFAHLGAAVFTPSNVRVENETTAHLVGLAAFPLTIGIERFL